MSNKKEINLTINRKTWLRGTDGSVLRNRNRNMCCLGHLGRTCGIDGKDMLLVDYPGALKKDVLDSHPLYKRLVLKQGYCDEAKGYITSSKFVRDAIHINDTSLLSPKDREEKLIKLFKTQNIKLSFKN